MPFMLSAFIERYPICVHRTHVDNVRGIKTIRQLWPAAELYAAAGMASSADPRRSHHDLFLNCTFARLRVNDQDPFLSQHGRFEGGWSVQRFVQELNRRVFFWPMHSPLRGGNGTSGQAAAFLRKYAERSVLLLMPTADLLAANARLVPEFTRCNSGTLSPRTRKHNVRGPMTFLPAQRFVGTLMHVRELAFSGRVRLPRSMRIIPAADAAVA